MAFDAASVQRLARLARIGISAQAAQTLGAELERILVLVDELKGADVAGVAPMAHPLALAQRLRADAVTETPDPTLYQRNAPDVTSGVYRVPRVIEEA